MLKHDNNYRTSNHKSLFISLSQPKVKPKPCLYLYLPMMCMQMAGNYMDESEDQDFESPPMDDTHVWPKWRCPNCDVMRQWEQCCFTCCSFDTDTMQGLCECCYEHQIWVNIVREHEQDAEEAETQPY